MGVVPNRGFGPSQRPLLESEIRHAQSVTKSAAEASRYLNVNYDTYKKYAKMYGIFHQHINKSGRGISRRKIKGTFGLDDILAGNHPTYSHTKLKERMIRAGYIAEECSMCGFQKKREIDNRGPFVLICVDGNNHNLKFENLELRCFNCVYLTTGKISARHVLGPGVYDHDVIGTGITMDEIERLQDEMMGD